MASRTINLVPNQKAGCEGTGWEPRRTPGDSSAGRRECLGQLIGSSLGPFIWESYRGPRCGSARVASRTILVCCSREGEGWRSIKRLERRARLPV
ncbi:sorting nexin 32 [Rhinolophus ferrumequinum]|uniref:Sorting nexin 32 n=1 Tax=Rhinolophus ferrumequinum TaxID=59479 RepID=A0A7J7WA83_RHIFE|nr:sorting nexin 32 [Rhinolophus ferrumequinum]